MYFDYYFKLKLLSLVRVMPWIWWLPEKEVPFMPLFSQLIVKVIIFGTLSKVGPLNFLEVIRRRHGLFNGMNNGQELFNFERP